MNEQERNQEDLREKEEYAYRNAVVFRMRLRVGEIVCGICTLLLGTVALIEEKTLLNLGLGIPSGLVTLLAAANGIYTSRGFDGYQAPSANSKMWGKFRFLGPNIKIALINTILWMIAFILSIIIILRSLRQITSDVQTSTLMIVASIELSLSVIWIVMVFAVAWIDMHYDPDWQEPSDLTHSNTATAVSMVALS